MLDHDTCYRAIAARDQRFDGKFFTGVTSTGVYCRPICPALTPKARNCTFFACAAAAEEAGFRPCLRCRPETAPGTPAWRGTSTTVSRGLRLIEQGALDEGSVAHLAGRLGVGARHLRRLFVEHLGAAPLSIAQTRRAHFARRLIADTRLPMTQIAFAAGYHNVRRFNAEIQRVFARTPRELRALGQGGRPAAPPTARDATITLRLSFRAPYDWRGLLGFVGARAIPGVERVSDGVYRRTVREGQLTGTAAISAPADGRGLLVEAPFAAAPALSRLSTRARALLDLGADPTVIARHLARDPRLAPLVRAHPGARVPGAWDPFETAVRAILGQQISVAAATRLAGRLVEAFGQPLEAAGAASSAPGPGPALTHLFPRPEDLIEADVARIGMPAARAASIRALAAASCAARGPLEAAPSLRAALAGLTALPGIGDWTAQYIAMRALGEPDAFPAGDLGLRKALATGKPALTEAAARRRAEPWRPWRAYAAIWLWRSLT